MNVGSAIERAQQDEEEAERLAPMSSNREDNKP